MSERFLRICSSDLCDTWKVRSLYGKQNASNRTSPHHGYGVNVLVSIVVPSHNEEDVLDSLVEQLLVTLDLDGPQLEIILVDDGSSDGTRSVMRRLNADDQRIRYIALSRNFGKEAAMLAGLVYSTGDAVVIMDADLQHPPALIVDMLRLHAEGYDQVVARRTRDGDSFGRTVAARLYYRAVNRMVDVDMKDGAGDFRLLSRRAVDALLQLGEYNRFSKGLFSWIGFPTATVDYKNVARQGGGASKWSFRRLVNYGIDGIMSFNNAPVRAAIYIGSIVMAMGFAYVVFLVIAALVEGISVPGYVTLVAAIVGLGGLQLLFLGVIGEYVGRIYYETKQRPHFLIAETEGDVQPKTVVRRHRVVREIRERSDADGTSL